MSRSWDIFFQPFGTESQSNMATKDQASHKRKNISPNQPASIISKKSKKGGNVNQCNDIKELFAQTSKTVRHKNSNRNSQPLSALEELQQATQTTANMAAPQAPSQAPVTPARVRRDQRVGGEIRSCEDMTAWFVHALRNEDIRAELSSIFQGTKEDVEENRQRIESLENEVERLSLEVDALEQYGRRNALRIYSPDWKEQMDESTDDMIMDLIINKLKLSDFPRWLISRSHRVGKPRTQEDRPRPILVKFISYRAREAVMNARKHLPRGTYINEDLTGATSRLAYQARELERANQISDTWTYDGRVYIKTTQATRGTVVRTLEDIFEKLTNDTAWNRPTTQSNRDQGSQMQRATPQATPQRASTTNKGPQHSTAPEGQLLGVHRPAKETTFPTPGGTSSTPLADRTATTPRPSPKMTNDRDHETTKTPSGSHKRDHRSAMPTPNRTLSLSRDGNLREPHLDSNGLPCNPDDDDHDGQDEKEDSMSLGESAMNEYLEKHSET